MVGEHIRALKGGRWNHAIDCGDETVIHLADDGARRAVRRSYRPEFVSGAAVVEIVTHRQRTFPADEVVARAYSRIADPMLAAMFASSESFARWCATGRPDAPGEDLARAASPASAAEPAKSRTRSVRAGRKEPAARPTKSKSSRSAGGGRAKAKRRPARSGASPRAGTKRRTPRRRPATKPRRR